MTVCPESAAWATRTRLEQTRAMEAANELADRTVVRALRCTRRTTPRVPTSGRSARVPGAMPALPPSWA
ncbi:hypothetical protein [Streptomyces abikoensis]|uniref:hypothetical protein n=1 Tax=Streptomyces abikoensis TaxID=97398 RepID=UPI0036AB55F4